jgi:hypothetical protein
MTDGAQTVNSIVYGLMLMQHVSMKRSRLATSAPLALLLIAAACAPLETYYRPGATVAAVNRDTTGCQVRALREVPVATQIRRLPPEYIPGRRLCKADGTCRVLPGRYIPGEIVTFDPNSPLRRRVETQCMADLGYAPVRIPACPDSIARAAPAGVTTLLPRLGERSCVIRNRDGSFQIVDRG